MTTLPTGDNNAGNPNDQISNPTGNKEIEGNIEMGELPLMSANPEINLPKEVVSAGVSVYPKTVSIPPNVAQMGVAATGANVPAAPTFQPGLPLTDDQIAVGLKKSMKFSLRWLAEWCVRKLKQLHRTLTKNKLTK